MKRLILIAAVLLTSVYCFSQNEGKINSLRNNITKSDAAINDPKKSVNVKTWLDRGKLFYDIYNVNVGMIRVGMAPTEANILLQAKPKQIIKVEVEDENSNEIYEFSKIKLHFKNGALEKREETDVVVENPLDESVNAYKKARTLDVAGKNEKKITDALKSINKDYEARFFNEYYLIKYLDAYNTALKRIDLSDYIGAPDTAFYFLAGFTAYIMSAADSTVNMWQPAIEHLEKAVSLGYKEYGENKGQIYHILYVTHITIEEPEKALHYAKTGFEKHPAYTDLMYDLINYYLKREENALALEYLAEAVARDPSNTLLLFAQGKVLDELGETEKSIASYDAAIAIDPTYFDPYFNKSVTYYNAAVKLLEQSNERNLTIAQADALVDKAYVEFYKAIAPMEKAYELKPDDKLVVETLKTIYFRLRNKYPELEAKWIELDKKLKEM
jgi:tetratricopeptide (TPR) repeat protein